MFTEIFNNEENICILEEFISFYLEIPLNKVRGHLELLSRKLKKENRIESKKEVDLLLDLDGEKINIELNNRCSINIIDRNVVYVGKVHGNQLKSGFRTYSEIKPTIQINLDNSNYEKELVENYYLRKADGGILTEKLRIDIINLEIGSKMNYTSNERTNMLIRWCKVFKSRTEKEINEAINDIISNTSKTRLLKRVSELSGDDEMVELYTDLNRREIEHNTLMEEALEKQRIENQEILEKQKMKYIKLIEEEKLKIAKKMLSKGISFDEIKEITGLDKLN